MRAPGRGVFYRLRIARKLHVVVPIGGVANAVRRFRLIDASAPGVAPSGPLARSASGPG